MTKTRTRAAGAKAAEDGFASARETIEAAARSGQEAAARGAEQLFDMARAQIDEANRAMAKTFDEMASYGKDNVDALVAAGAIVAKGWEELGRHMMTVAQESVEQGLAATRSALTAKDMREAIDVQTGLVRSLVDTMVAETNRLSEFSVKVAGEAMAPLNARVNATFEKLNNPLAV